MLDRMATKYLLHRFDAVNDKNIWPSIISECPSIGEKFVHMDFSEHLDLEYTTRPLKYCLSMSVKW